MTFNRAFVLAIVVAAVGDVYHDTDDSGWARLIIIALIYALGSFLWRFTDDPLPGAVKRGLEDFAREYRK